MLGRTDLGEHRLGDIGCGAVAGVGEGEHDGARRLDVLGRIIDRQFGGPPVPAGRLVELSAEQRHAADERRHLGGDVVALPFGGAQAAPGTGPRLVEVAGHPGGVAAHRPDDTGERAAVLGVGGRHALGPREDVGPHAEEAVVEQPADEAAGELRLLVVEQPAECGAQLGQGRVERRQHGLASRLEQRTVGRLDPLHDVPGMALGRLVRPCRPWRAARRRRPAASPAARTDGRARASRASARRAGRAPRRPRSCRCRRSPRRRATVKAPAKTDRSANVRRSDSSSSPSDHEMAAVSDPCRDDVR